MSTFSKKMFNARGPFIHLIKGLFNVIRFFHFLLCFVFGSLSPFTFEFLDLSYKYVQSTMDPHPTTMSIPRKDNQRFVIMKTHMLYLFPQGRDVLFNIFLHWEGEQSFPCVFCAGPLYTSLKSGCEKGSWSMCTRHLPNQSPSSEGFKSQKFREFVPTTYNNK